MKKISVSPIGKVEFLPCYMLNCILKEIISNSETSCFYCCQFLVHCYISQNKHFWIIQDMKICENFFIR